MNLKQETLKAIEDCGYDQDEVAWVGSEDGQYQLSLSEFLEIADIDYDDGFGRQEIALDLIVMFNDNRYIIRDEYDGSECWNIINRKNLTVEKPKKFTNVCVNQVGATGWSDLEELNKDVI